MGFLLITSNISAREAAMAENLPAIKESISSLLFNVKLIYMH